MPIYEFKCPVCSKCTEVILSFSEYGDAKEKTVIGQCSNNKCTKILKKADQIINFAGTFNMNASAMGINQRTYNNKTGGPHGIIGGTSTGKATAKKGGLNIGPTGL